MLSAIGRPDVVDQPPADREIPLAEYSESNPGWRRRSTALWAATLVGLVASLVGAVLVSLALADAVAGSALEQASGRAISSPSWVLGATVLACGVATTLACRFAIFWREETVLVRLGLAPPLPGYSGRDALGDGALVVGVVALAFAANVVLDAGGVSETAVWVAVAVYVGARIAIRHRGRPGRA